MNKRALSGLVAVGLFATLPATVGAADAESETVTADWTGTYDIPEQVAELDALGELGQINHGCPTGLYFLADGTAKLDGTMTFTPSQAAFEANELGASMEVAAKNKYKGLWARSEDGGFPWNASEYFVLHDNGIRYEALFEVREYVNEDGLTEIGPVVASEELRWQGEFLTADTKKLVEDWRFRVTVIEGELDEKSIIEGSCAG